MPSPTPSEHRYFLDISGSMERVRKRDIFSGVQRVVMTLGHELAQILPPEQLFITWYDRKLDRFLCLSYAAVPPGVLMDARAMRAVFFPKEHARKIRDEILAGHNGARMMRLRLGLAARLGQGRAFSKYGITPADWRGTTKSPKSAALQDVARSGDHLLMLDLAPNPQREAALARLRGIGMRNITLVHDLIPLVAPQFVTDRTALKFHDWLITSTGYTDLYLANSQATRRDLQAFLDQKGTQTPVVVLPLAQDRIPNAVPKGLQERDPRVTNLIGTPYVLCVGAIEPRKNNTRIAQAWKALVDAGHKDLPTLVFVGRVKEESAEFVAFLNSHAKELGAVIQILDAPSDASLDLLYQNCLFTIQASLYEGWGLPAGEALSYGKTGILSSRASLPEVGGDLVVYCDPEDVDSIATAVKQILQAAKRENLEVKIAHTALRRWDNVAAQLRELVDNA